MSVAMNHDIKDAALADSGLARIEWAYQEMPVLHELAQRLSQQQPLDGIRISGCLHSTTETANLATAQWVTVKVGSKAGSNSPMGSLEI